MKTMNIKRLFFPACLAAALFAGSTGTANAQTKAETKLYKSVLAKQDLKTASKFLAKFPNSTYAQQVAGIRDSIVFFNLDGNDVTAYVTFLENNPKSAYAARANARIEQLNTSSISNPEAFSIAKEAGIPEQEILAVKGVKNLNKEHVVAIAAPVSGEYTLHVISQENGEWKKVAQVEETIYTNDPELGLFKLTPEIYTVTLGGAQHLFFAYTNSSDKAGKRSNIPNNNVEYVANLYSMADNSIYNVLYSGKAEGDEIYGSTMDSAQGGMMATPQQTYLLRHLRANENLKPYDKEMFRTQKTIEWWYENNPQNAGNLQFGIIPAESELARKFTENKGKEKVGQYTVAMFDICHNTVVVVYNREDQRYSLALCQPVPQGKNSLELNTFYGEKGNTLVLYYYKGKTPIKKRLNLGSKRMY